MRRALLVVSCVTVLAACGEPPPQAPGGLIPAGATAPVPHDPDDPAIWVSQRDPARSLILGTDKAEQVGGLFVFGVDGALRQTIALLDRPNNVDVEYDVTLGPWTGDVAVVTERKQRRLRLFGIPADGGLLVDLAPQGLPVLDGETGEAAEPMGVGLYRRPGDAALFAVVAPKAGPPQGYLAQYRIASGDDGRPAARLVRRFGAFSGRGPAPGEPGEIEAVVVDDELGYVYYADERCCLRKYAADPDSADANRELARIGEGTYRGDREGLALYRAADGRGYLVSSDQLPGGTILRVYRREGEPGAPHAHPEVAALPTASDETDGLDVAAAPLPGFAGGLLVMMNSGPKNFLFYRWADLGLPPLTGPVRRPASP